MFLAPAPTSAASEALYAKAVAEDGYVGNVERLWAWRPESLQSLFDLLESLASDSTLTLHDRAAMVPAVASALGDSYCALAWGSKLARLTNADTAAAMLRGDTPAALKPRQAALAGWARRVAKAPNETTPDDVQRLRDAGLSEREIFDATVYAALRVAFSTVNDALGARPDAQLAQAAPDAVRRAVDYGRKPDDAPPDDGAG